MNSKPFRLDPPLCRSIFPDDSHRVVQNPSISLHVRHLIDCKHRPNPRGESQIMPPKCPIQPPNQPGTLPTPDSLVNIPRLVTAFYSLHPDPAVSAQRVAFGTSGHRGSAFTASFNEDHIAAISAGHRRLPPR